MASLSSTAGAFAVSRIARYGTSGRSGRLVPAETAAGTIGTSGNDWRLQRGCGATFEVYDQCGAYLGQLVAPSHPGAPEFGGDTVYLDRTHLSVFGC